MPKIRSSNFDTSANLQVNTALVVAGNLVISNASTIIANGSVGTAGQMLTSNGTGVYWLSPQLGDITNVIAGTGLTGGGASGEVTVSLATSGVVANTYGNTSSIPVITVDTYGRVTNVSTTAVAGVTNFTYTGANNTFSISTGAGSTFTANILLANSSVAGVVTVLDSVTNTSSLIAASVNSVKTAYDSAISANTRAASAQTAAISAYSNAVSYTDGAILAANVSGAAATAYSNAVSYAANIAGTAYSNAISTAAADATSKANNAYTTAVSAASSDATSKAANAYSNAISYAATIAGTAYSNAVSAAATDATSKANNAYTTAVAAAASDATTKANNAYDTAVSAASTDATNKAANAYSNATAFASNASNISSGTLGEARLPYRMNQNVRTTDSVTFANGSFTGTLSVGGDLIVTGNVESTNVQSLAVSDPLIKLGVNNPADTSWGGFTFHYNGSGNTTNHAGLVRNPATKEFILMSTFGDEVAVANNNTINVSDPSFSYANLQVNVLTTQSANVGGATINSTTFTGTANNTAFVGSVAAANVVSNTQLSSNLANYQTTAGLSANVATLTANNASNLGGQAASFYAANSQLSGYALLSGAAFTGNVGIGIASPAAKLHINGLAANGTVGVADVLVLGRALTGAVSFEQSAIFKLGRHTVAGGTYQSSSRLDIALKTDDAVSDYTTTSTVMSLLNNGNVGIGTTSPGRRLSLKGGGFAFDDADITPRSLHWGNGTTYPVLIQGDANNNFLAIQTASTERMRIDSSGRVGINTTSPSEELEAFGTDASIIVHQSGQSRGGIAALSGARIALTTTTSGDDLVFGYAGSPITSAGFVPRMTIDNGTGSITSGVDFRAPIFYDSSNTAFYVDPAGGSVLSSLVTRGQIQSNEGVSSSTNDAGLAVFRSSFAGTGNYRHSIVTRHNSAANTNNSWDFYLWRPEVAAGAEATHRAFIIDGDAGTTSTIASRAPIFYDSDSTGYYVNPASDSTLANVVLASTIDSALYYDTALEIRERSFAGAQTTSYNNAPRLSWHWGGRVASQLVLDSANVLNLMNGDCTGWTTFRAGDISANIMYDRNDGAYYVNPAETSVFNGLTVGGSQVMRGTGTGVDLGTNWNTLGNTVNTIYEIYQGAFNVGGTGSSNFPSSASYKYGTLINFSANLNARAQMYISHNGNDLIFRGGWTDSSWQTWNKVLTDVNYNSYAPTLTGTGASGSWGINVTGKANDLAMARYVNNDFNTLGTTGQVFRAYTNYLPSGGSYNQPTTGAQDFKVIQWGDVDGGSSGNWGGQIVQNFYDDRMWFRRSYGTTWQAWREFIHDGNYTSFAMPIGSSATNTVDIRAPIFYDNADTSFYLDLRSNPVTPTISLNMNGDIRSKRYSHPNGIAWDTEFFLGETSNSDVNGSFPTYITGYGLNIRKNSDGAFFGLVTYDGGTNYHTVIGWGDDTSEELQFRFNNVTKGVVYQNGTIYAIADHRAPIFYDSNDTGYFINPAEATSLAGWAKINLTTGSGINEDGRGFVINGSYTDGRYSTRFRKWDDGGGLPLYVQQTVGTAGSWSSVASFGASNARYAFHVDGISFASASLRSPIFYNSNDTNVRWEANNLVLRGTSPTMYFRDTDEMSAMIHVNSNLFYVLRGGVDTESWSTAANSAWPMILNLSNNNADFGGIVNAVTDVRAPIFYDRNNTGYYIDPTGSTSLRIAGDIRSDAGSWTGESAGKIQYHADNWYLQFTNALLGRNASGSDIFTVMSSGQVTASADFRSQLFYDSNNTNYYVNPAGSSVLYSVEMINQRCSFSRQWDNYPGISVYNTTDQGPQSDFRIFGSVGANGGDFSVRLLVDGEITSLSNVNAGSAMYAPIYYDSNDSGYYFNGNGGSVLSTAYIINKFYARGNTGVDECCGSDATISVGGSGTRPPSISWHYSGVMQGNMQANQTGWRKVYFYDDQGSGLGVHATGQIASNADVIAYYSDKRLKKDLVRVVDHWNVINNLNGYRFTWNEKSGEIPGFQDKVGKREVGLIAQDVQAVYPEAIAMRTEGPEDDPYMTIKHDRFTAVFIEALKDLRRELDEVKEENKKLREMINGQ